MTPAEYLILSAVTDDTSPENMERRRLRLSAGDTVINDLHAICGIVTEGAELMDAYKKQVFYGKPMDETNIKEEIGDVLWYVALLCRNHGITIEDAMDTNIRKLKKRYGEKFTEHAALNRDLKGEYATLEATHKVFRVSYTNELDGQHYICALNPSGEFSTSPHKGDAKIYLPTEINWVRAALNGKLGIDYLFATE